MLREASILAALVAAASSPLKTGPCRSTGILPVSSTAILAVSSATLAVSMGETPMLLTAETAVLLQRAASLAQTPGGDDIKTATTAAAAKPPSVSEIKAFREKLRPLHAKLGKPGPRDWLAQHQESGQTFEEYLKSDPPTPQGQRRAIYIQPLGDFTPKQRQIVELTGEFLGLYYRCPVKVQKDVPLAVIPASARRTHPQWGDKQILSTYVLDLLKKDLPKDAAARIAFTASDLWPGEGWNFVFGQASLEERVGVWSIYRNGEPEKSEAELRLCLLRTMKTASHELGHMFGMYHCTAYECNMCGSNHREEADRRPIALCPECVAKVWWACRVDPVERYRVLAEWYDKHGLKDEAAFCRKATGVITGK